MTRLRGRVLTALVLLLPPAVGTMVHLVTRNHLPDRIPFPWDWSGGRLSDGMGGSSASFYLTNVYSYVVVGIALLLVAANRRGKRSRSAVLGGGVASAMAFSFWAKTELVAYGAPALSAVDIEPWQTLLSVIAIGAYGWLLQSVMPVEPQQDRRAPESKLEFQPSLRVLWTGRAVNRVKLWVVVALVGGSVGVAAFTASAAVALLIVAGWLWWGYLAKARIGNAGVSISRVAGWPTHHLPLDRVTRARTQTVRVTRCRAASATTRTSTRDPSSAVRARLWWSRAMTICRCTSASTTPPRRPTCSMRSSSGRAQQRCRREHDGGQGTYGPGPPSPSDGGRGDPRRLSCSPARTHPGPV